MTYYATGHLAADEPPNDKTGCSKTYDVTLTHLLGRVTQTLQAVMHLMCKHVRQAM